MSSHREAPYISQDPAADSTDVYAFVSPDEPDMVTIIANYVPFEGPAAGPNFYEFGNDVQYEINISNRNDQHADVTYYFNFFDRVQNPDTFLYNTGPITSLTDPNFNRRQTFKVTRADRANGFKDEVLGDELHIPPCNVGFRSTPHYSSLAAKAVHHLPGSRKVFAGQRADGFYADLGKIFDLLALPPFEAAHLIPSPSAQGINSLKHANILTIALQVPITDLTKGGRRAKADDPDAVIGVWTAASRRRSRVYDNTKGYYVGSGRSQQLSRLGNPLVNEVLIPLGKKDYWNTLAPHDDIQFAEYFNHPEVQGLLPVLYPGAFPNLAAYKKPRADLVAILGTGIPSGIIPGFQNYTGPVVSDMLRLNTAIKPAAKPSPLGILGGDLAGFPNGRRPIDDVVAIELRAIAGVTIPLVDPTFTPDAVSSQLTDGTTAPKFMSHFPYLGTPHSGTAVDEAA